MAKNKNKIDWDGFQKKIEEFGAPIYQFELCKRGEQIGSGAAMTVYRGTCDIGGKVVNVAFKEHRKLNSIRVTQRELEQVLGEFRHEINLMRRLKSHKHVVDVFGVTFNDHKPLLIVELGDLTLDHYLWERHDRGETVGWTEKVHLCLDVLRGVQGLHAADIIHGDLKGDNILVFLQPNGFPLAKISDFGYSSTLTSSKVETGGTRNFMAPECMLKFQELELFQKQPTIDVYAYGLVLYQIANNGAIPYEGAEDIIAARCDDIKLEILLKELPEDTPEGIILIVRATTQFYPPHRAKLSIVEKLFQNLVSQQCISDQITKTRLEYRARLENLNLDWKPVLVPINTIVSLALDGEFEVLRMLVEDYNSHLDARDSHGRSALHHLMHNYTALKDLVLKCGVDVDSRDATGRTTLHLAVENGRIDIVKALVEELSADINARDNENTTPLHLAALHGRDRIAKILAKEYGADINLRDKNNLTALSIAKWKMKTTIVDMLIDLGGIE